MLWTYRLLKLVKYIVATLLVFNAFQSIFMRTSRNATSLSLTDLLIQQNQAKEQGPHYKQECNGSTFEKISFYSKKDETGQEKILRNGMLTLRPDAQATVLICHGYLCNKHDIAFMRTLFPEHNSLIFDFRAHGENIDGQCCTFGKNEAFDVIGAAEFLKNHPKLKGQKLFGYGFSMGAVSLIEAQAKQPLFDGLILDCPFDSSETILSRALDQLKISLFGYTFNLPGRELLREYTFNQYVQPIAKFIFKLVAGFDATKINSRLEKIVPAESVKNIKVPCLFIHCKNDDKIPVAAVRSIYDGAQGYKRLWVTKGRGHCDSYFSNPEEYVKKANKFLTTIKENNCETKEQSKVKEDL